MSMRFLIAAFLALQFLVGGSSVAGDEMPPVILAIDAEFGVSASTSAQAIQRGAEIAAAEVNAGGGVLAGRSLKIVTRNNNSMPARAAENLKELAADPNVVAVMGGKYSPVYEQLLPLIHEIGIPYLNPWAAADGITEHHHRPDFMFRLSATDSWAMRKMIDSAGARGIKRVGLLLPNSGWGRSCLSAAKRAVNRRGVVRIVGERWFNFGDRQFGSQYDELRQAGAEAIVFVGNELEGDVLVREIARRAKPEQLPVVSHWGVSGGEFFKAAGPALAQVDFTFVQTYSFVDAQGARARAILSALKKNYGVADAREVESPVGLAHAYDLTHLLAQAVAKAGSTDRRAVRDALENLPAWTGLVKRYSPPFTANRHDALDASLLFIARYRPDGAIVRIR